MVFNLDQKEDTVVIITGNIGTKKSTYVKKYLTGGHIVVMNHDAIIESLYGGRYVYNEHKRPIYTAVKRAILATSLANHFNVVIDNTNMTRLGREYYIQIACGFNTNIVSLDFGKGNDFTLLNRQQAKDGRKVTNAQWARVHQEKQGEYEKPSYDEGFDEIYDIEFNRVSNEFDIKQQRKG